MAITLHELFGNTTVTGVVSRIATPLSRFQRFWGMQVGGPSTNEVGGINFMWDTFDRTRHLASARAVDTGPKNAPLQKIGNVKAAAIRLHEKVRLSEARLQLLRNPGEQWGIAQASRRGQGYATRQMESMGQRFANSREFMVSRMMKGEFGVLDTGDTWYLVDSAGKSEGTDYSWKVDYQIPAENKQDLATITGIAGTWATAATDIPGQLGALNAKFEEWTGYPLRHIFCTNKTLQDVMNNDGMKGRAGTANRVFTTYNPEGIVSAENIPSTGHTVVFEALPWLTFHVYDGGLAVGRVNMGTYTKFIEDDKIFGCPDPSPNIAEWYSGSEVVAENLMDVGTERYGFYSWTSRVIDPAGFEMKALDLGLPALLVPKSIVYSTV